MRRSLIAASIALTLAVCTSGTAFAPDRGLLSDVPRAQFVDNVALGSLERTPHDPVAPTPKLADGDRGEWDAGVEPTKLGGTTTIQAGQLIYQDWILDDTGAARTCVVERRERNRPVEEPLGWSKYQAMDSLLGEELIGDVDALGVFDQPQTECEKGVERYGAARYPPDATQGSADILEFRVAADAEALHVLVRLNALTPSDDPVVALALDVDRKLTTGAGIWGLGSQTSTRGADLVVHLTRDGVLDAAGAAVAGAAVAVNDLGAGGADNPDGFGGVIEASLPRALIGPRPAVRMWAGTGLWDATAGEWRAPVTDEDGPRVFNIAFRGGREPLRTWMEESQAFELRTTFNAGATLSDRFSVVADLDALASGAHETWRVRPGYYVRIFTSRVTDGQRNGSPAANPEAGPVSARQPYGLYVPTTYLHGIPSPLTVWLHWRGPGDHQAAYYVPNMVHELAESRGSILVSPRGRGSSGWYVGDSQIDVLDAMADAEDLLTVEADKVYVAGYSMGGWGAYLLSMLYPDRFAGALSVVGPPAIGFWFGAVDPIEPQNGRPLYFTNPLVGNARHVPTAIMHGTSDELVPISGTSAHAKTYLDNQQPYRFFLFAGYEHFSFALADEWFAAVDYLGTQPRVRRPARVTYTRMPCLDPMRWSPVYDEVADGAYWLDGIVVPDMPSDAACTSSDTPTAQLWHRGSVDFTVVTSYLTPRRMQPVAGGGGPPQHTGAYALTGYDADHLAPGTPRDQFQAVVRNVSSFRIAALEAGLDDLPMFGNIDTDRTVTIHLDGLSGGRVLLDGASLGDFTGSVTIPPGKHFLSILA